MNRTQETALAMLTVLDAVPDGESVLASDLRAGVEALGAKSQYIPDAAKSLRQMGVLLVATKARHLSSWCVYRQQDGDPQSDAWDTRVVKESYSEFVSMAQAMYYGAERTPSIEVIRERVVRSCIDLGRDLGKSMMTVIEECKPIAARA